MIDIAGLIWNHLTALQKRYYRRFGKHISQARMKKHIAHLRKRSKKYVHW
jgi:putative transposase